MASLRNTRKKKVALASAVAVATGAVLLAATATSSAGVSVSLNDLAPQLASNQGIAALPDMVKIGEGGARLAPSKGLRKDEAPAEIAKYDASYKPTGGLGQAWVLQTAIQTYGKLGSGLELPLPLDFAKAHPGPAEVFVEVLSFASPDKASAILEDADFNGTSGQGYSPVSSSSFHNALVGRIDSAANGGMDEYRVQWALGAKVVQVNVVGSGLTPEASLAVAKLVDS